MIFTERTITVVNDSATINKPLILYRGDKNIELKITIAESQFKFRNTDASNVIETTDASYAQLVINTPYNSPIFSDVAATKNGAVIFVITEAMIDEIREVGAYEIQIRLLDDNKQSRASIPPVSNAIEIREPIAIEDGSAVDSNVVNVAKVNRALTTTSAPLEAFDSQGNYIKKTWGDGDPITDAALNKMEAGIDGVNKKIANGYVTKETGNANQITFADGQTFQAKLDDGTLKGDKGDTGEQGPQGIQGEKGDPGEPGASSIDDTTASATTTYSSNKIETIKINLNSQIKEIENVKADKTTTNNIQQQVNNLVLGAVGDGNNPEVVQARGIYNTLNDRLDYSDSLLPKTLISSKNLYAYNSTYACKHYKYIDSNGYYALNDEANYSTIFIPVNPGKYTMQLFNIAPALGIIEFELFYLSVNNMSEIENGIDSGVTIGDKLQFNDNFYNEGLIDKLSFTIPNGNIMLAITGITELLTENYFKIQLEINDGTDTYEKHSDSYEIVRLKNSPYLEKSDFDVEKNSINSNIANITKEIEVLKNSTNINTYTIKNYKIGIQNEPTMYESTIETKLLEERDTPLIDNPTTISSVIDGNTNMFFNYFRSPMALKNNTFVTSSATDYANNGRGGFNRIGFSTDAPAFDIFIYGIMRYRLLVNEGDGWKYVNSKNPVNIGTNDGSFRWVNFNFKTSLIRQFILETNDPFGGVRYNQNYSIFPLVENSKPLTVWTGSSITEGSAVTNFQGMSFAALTSNKLGMNWINVGVGATGYLQTVAENGRKKLRDRFSTDVYPLKPDLLIIEGGINDFSFPIEDIKTEVQSCINDVKTNIPNTYLVLIGVYFPSGSGYSTADDINTAIREIASLNNIPFIDLLKGEIIGTDGTVLIKLNPFIDNNRKTTYLNLSEDQTHLNTVGHEAMKEFLTIALMNILK